MGLDPEAVSGRQLMKAIYYGCLIVAPGVMGWFMIPSSDPRLLGSVLAMTGMIMLLLYQRWTLGKVRAARNHESNTDSGAGW